MTLYLLYDIIVIIIVIIRLQKKKCCSLHLFTTLTIIENNKFGDLFKGTSILDRIRNLHNTRTEKDSSIDAASRKKCRKIKVGWKHTDKSGKSTFVTAKKGGGTNDIFMSKYSTLEELTTQFANIYFPNGHNKSMNLNIQDLKLYVATFSGDRVEAQLPSGQIFTLEKYLSEVLDTTPVRLYLCTQVNFIVIYETSN